MSYHIKTPRPLSPAPHVVFSQSCLQWHFRWQISKSLHFDNLIFKRLDSTNPLIWGVIKEDRQQQINALDIMGTKLFQMEFSNSLKKF